MQINFEMTSNSVYIEQNLFYFYPKLIQIFIIFIYIVTAEKFPFFSTEKKINFVVTKML